MWCHKKKICEIKGFVRILGKNNIQMANLPDISIPGQIVIFIYFISLASPIWYKYILVIKQSNKEKVSGILKLDSDISPVMLWWLHTNPSKFDSVHNIRNQINFRTYDLYGVIRTNRD